MHPIDAVKSAIQQCSKECVPATIGNIVAVTINENKNHGIDFVNDALHELRIRGRIDYELTETARGTAISVTLCKGV